MEQKTYLAKSTCSQFQKEKKKKRLFLIVQIKSKLFTSQLHDIHFSAFFLEVTFNSKNQPPLQTNENLARKHNSHRPKNP
jgi:hypothetical protein